LKRSVALALVAAAFATPPPVAAQRVDPDTVMIAGAPLVVHRYEPDGEPRCPAVLLLSGDGGWQQGVVHWAKALAAEGHEVVGVDATRLVTIAGGGGLAGVVDNWSALSRVTRTPPVVLGYSRGATIGLALATRAEPPPPVVLMGVDLEDHFDGPAVPPGLTPGVKRHSDYVVDLRPLFATGARTARVAVVHGMLDRVAPYATVEPWLDRLPEPRRLTILPKSGHGFGDSRTVLPAISESLSWAATGTCP